VSETFDAVVWLREQSSWGLPQNADELEQVADEIERLRIENADLRSCACGAILDDYREALAILSEDGIVRQGSLAQRLRAEVERLRSDLSDARIALKVYAGFKDEFNLTLDERAAITRAINAARCETPKEDAGKRGHE